jgi:hypothetical protein
VWERFGYTTGVHLRRIHYQLLSTGALTATGETYENTEQCWYDLRSAGSAARQLGLVDPESFVDRRNSSPRLNVEPREEPAEPRAGWEPPLWYLPELDPAVLDDQIDFDLPGFTVSGYDYEPDDQPVLLEVWIEKSTMDDVLVPLCRELHANLVSAVGFESITNTIALLRRAERHGKPAHVLYVADFDPAGDVMPISVARQAQFWREQLDIQAELTIDRVALTAEQVQRYQLPRIPIKESDQRGKRFEQRNGEGAVELDALEALYPGALAEAVHHGAQPYVDSTLPGRLGRAHWQAVASSRETWSEATEQVRADLEALEDEVRVTVARYREELEVLAEQLDGDLAPYRERLERISTEAGRIAHETESELGLPARPEPEALDVDRSRLLFDSTRHWREQLRVFKAWQAGETP